MTNLFQAIIAKVSTFFTAAVISITSILPWSGTSTNKPIDSPTVQPMEFIVQVSTPSATTSPTATPVPRAKATTIPTREVIPTAILTISPSPVPTRIQPQTYSIIPISAMNVSSMNPDLQVVARQAYQEFLRTPSLSLLTESKQIEILMGIYTRLLQEAIRETKQNIVQLKIEPTVTPTPSPTPAPTTVAIYANPEAESKLSELRQTLQNIQDQPVAMNIIVGRTQRAYQDWVTNNSGVYSAILGSRYINDLNVILRTYGL